MTGKEGTTQQLRQQKPEGSSTLEETNAVQFKRSWWPSWRSISVLRSARVSDVLYRAVLPVTVTIAG